MLWPKCSSQSKTFGVCGIFKRLSILRWRIIYDIEIYLENIHCDLCVSMWQNEYFIQLRDVMKKNVFVRNARDVSNAAAIVD